jgi:hypothetical protein
MNLSERQFRATKARSGVKAAWEVEVWPWLYCLVLRTSSCTASDLEQISAWECVDVRGLEHRIRRVRASLLWYVSD